MPSNTLLQLKSDQSPKQPPVSAACTSIVMTGSAGQAWLHEGRLGQTTVPLVPWFSPHTRTPLLSGVPLHLKTLKTVRVMLFLPQTPHWPHSPEPGTKMGDQQAVAVDFHLRIWNIYSKSFPGRLSKSCYHPIHPNHLLPLAILLCKELKLFPDSFSRSASRTMALLKELWVWPFWSQEPRAKHPLPREAHCFLLLRRAAPDPQISCSKPHYCCLIFLLLFFVPTGPFLLPCLPTPPKSLLLPLYAPAVQVWGGKKKKKIN